MTSSTSSDFPPKADRGGRSQLHRQLMRAMLEDIAHGRYAVDERLPSEVELSRELKASRGVIRELLRSLADRGVVSIQHGRGSWVNPSTEWDMLDADVLGAMMPTPASVSVLTHYLECRRILETQAASLAAQRASSRDMAGMADAIAEMAALAEGPETDSDADRRYHAADIRFHSAIFRASGNQILPRIVAPIQLAMATLRPRLALEPEERVRKTLPEHKAILAAIADQDPDQARRAMEAHLATVENTLRIYRMQMSDDAEPESVADPRSKST